MDRAQVQAKPEATAAPAASGLGVVARTGVLLMGMVLASVLLVDLPIPAGRVADSGAPFVPVSERWIDLGAPQRPDAGPVPEQFRRATAAPAALQAAPDKRRLARKSRGDRIAGIAGPPQVW